jgi:hypothetical protein
LKAPALADETSTVKAITIIFDQPINGPGVTTSPTNAVIMIMNPMRSLNSPRTLRTAWLALIAPDESVGRITFIKLVLLETERLQGSTRAMARVRITELAQTPDL